MKNFHARCIIIILAVLLCLSGVFAAMAQESDPSSTVIRVEVEPNGDALWITEKSIPLNTQDDIDAWDLSASYGTEQYRVDFEKRMKEYVDKISNYTGRKMTVKNVNVTLDKTQPYAIIGNYSVTYGVLKYEFVWTGFALVENDMIEIGDAFVDGFLLSRNDSLKFILPQGYDITHVSPQCDEFKDTYRPQLIWNGNSKNNTNSMIRLFSTEEPSITMRNKVSPSVFSFDWWVLIPVALIFCAAGFGSAYMLFRGKRKPIVVEIPEIEDRHFDHDYNDSREEEETPATVSPIDNERYMSDEEKIIKYLEESGGQMFQSDLVKKTAFSKSKLSMVLSDLKEKGVIIKIKKGKENLIRLNRNSDEPEKE
ncbi:hypothetical protein CUJ83_09110 [Methanocella sp. CWC-04]|uniref:MarR family protein n=1 Tax=Methanooceanicella nereidis TaxID=2052831 RepID=A0AAP2W560_9EURY|nr:DUF4897 domain-containing protein [Methanocella sp. CWC-04]MCD1295155.1 hypothetical protein [Methanocella sp. CWC-04]